MNLSEISHGGGSADGRQVGFVPVVEVLSWFAPQFISDVVGSSLAGLHGDRCDSGKPLAAFVLQGGQVSDYEDFWMSGDTEVGIHQHAPGAIYGRSQLFPQR